MNTKKKFNDLSSENEEAGKKRNARGAHKHMHQENNNNKWLTFVANEFTKLDAALSVKRKYVFVRVTSLHLAENNHSAQR